MDSPQGASRANADGGSRNPMFGVAKQDEKTGFVRSLSYRNFAASLAVAWTVLLFCFGWWEVREIGKHANEKARLDAAMSFQKDALYRLWASKHGGVYVPVTADTQPNPYLVGIPEREIVTPSGRQLTLMNPAYMTRQVHELAAARFGDHSHITSLKPIRPGNAPDPWEREALQKFEKGVPEVSEVIARKGEAPVMRFMRPFITEKSCLKCHAVQGYKEGDVRGGISVTIGLNDYFGLARRQTGERVLSYAVIWIVGLVWLFTGFFLLNRHRKAHLASVEALKVSEEKFSTLFHHAPVLASLSVLEDGTFLEVNDQFCEALECSREEIVGRKSTDFGVFVSAERSRFAEQVRLHGKVRGVEMIFQSKSGRKIYTLTNAEMVNLAGRQCLLSAIVDITERRQIEIALARDEAELVAIYEHAPSMMMLIDKESKVRRYNHAATAFARRFSNEGSMDGLDQLPGGMADLTVIRVAENEPGTSGTLRSAIQDTLNSGVSHSQIEIQPRAVNNGMEVVFTLLASTAQVQIGDERMVLVCLEDITQQKLAEQRIREQAALLDVTQDAIMVLDLEGRVTYWNRGAVKLYGWTVEEAIGRTIQELYRGVPDGFTKKIEGIRKTGNWQGNCQMQTRDGTAIIALCHGVMMYDAAGNPRSILLSASDITESKRIEAQLLRTQRLESIGSLAGGVAHDLNNVLGPIMLSMGVLRAVVRGPQSLEIVDLIDRSVHRGSDIVRKLLLFGRGSEMAAPMGDVALSSIAKDLQHLFQETFPKNIVLSLRLPADLWRIRGDKTQLYQVVLNLCVNARDAMAQGGSLTLVAKNMQLDEAFIAKHPGARTGPHVLLQVADTGTGMSEQLIDKIFDPFFTTKSIGQGSGLGLSTTLGIVRAHGGFISVDSKLGVGTTFKIYLPANTSSDNAEVIARQAVRRMGQGECILVVDDEQSFLYSSKRALTASGFKVLTANSGREALEMLASRKAEVSLVVSDIMMPEMDGFQLVQAIRREMPKLPIIAMSGLHDNRGPFDQLADSRIGHLYKPFGPDDLLGKIHEILEKVRSAD